MGSASDTQLPRPVPAPPSGAALTYRLASDVPDNWVPFLPMMAADGLRPAAHANTPNFHVRKCGT
jgi:hypothetical protein